MSARVLVQMPTSFVTGFVALERPRDDVRPVHTQFGVMQLKSDGLSAVGLQVLPERGPCGSPMPTHALAGLCIYRGFGRGPLPAVCPRLRTGESIALATASLSLFAELNNC